MRVIDNKPLVKRYSLIAKALSFIGLATLVGGLVVSFTWPDKPYIPLYTLLIGFVMSNVGIHLTNRYVREPRPDDALTKALKTLDDAYSIYHFRLSASHAVIGPTGVFAILPKFQSGTVTWDDKHKQFRQANTGWVQRTFGQEGIGNPVLEALAEARRLEKQLKRKFGNDAPPVLPLIVFTNAKVEVVNLSQSPVPAFKAQYLSTFFKKSGRTTSLSLAQIAQLDGAHK